MAMRQGSVGEVVAVGGERGPTEEAMIIGHDAAGNPVTVLRAEIARREDIGRYVSPQHAARLANVAHVLGWLDNTAA